MTAKMTVSEILQAAAQLSLEDQRLLNSHLVDQIKRTRAIESLKIARTLSIGTVVSFDAGPRKGIKYMRINSFNRAGTMVVGPETDSKGNPLGLVRWTVPNTAVKAI